jgi:gliding motility-associated-like protein
MQTSTFQLLKIYSVAILLFVCSNSFGQVLKEKFDTSLSMEEKLANYQVNYDKIQVWLEANNIKQDYVDVIANYPQFNNEQINFLANNKIGELRFYINREMIQRGWNESKNAEFHVRNKNELISLLAGYGKADFDNMLFHIDEAIAVLEMESHAGHSHADKNTNEPILKGPSETNEPLPTPEGPGQICTNPGFEMSNFTNWNMIRGTVATASGPYSFLNPVNMTIFGTVNFLGGGIGTQHNITTGGIDPKSNLPMVCPGGARSALLGDGTITGGNASRIMQTFLVDNSSSILTMNYHVVLQDPSHTAAEQPYFQIRVYDQNGAPITCASYSAFANDGQPGWAPYSPNGFIEGYYLPWTTVVLPLTGYVGQNITVEATSGDCTLSGHYGYGYVDFTCEPITFNVTGSAPCYGPYTLEGPNGGLAYNWSTGDTTQGITVTSLGYYSVDITPITGGSCTIFLDTIITGWPQFTTYANLTNPSICEGENTRAWIDSSIASYQHEWILPNGTTYSGHSFPINNATIADAGLYQVITLDTISNCMDTASITLVVNVSPVLSSNDETICFGDSVAIAATGASNFTWDNGLPAGHTHMVSPPTSTWYRFTGTDANGCFDEDSLFVTVNPLPTISAGNDSVVCENGTAVLNGQGGVSYVWDQGVTNGVVFSPTQTLTYTVVGTDANGCSETDDVTLIYEAFPVVSFMGDVLEGCQPLVVNFTNTTSGNLSNCEWSFQDGTVLNDCNSVQFVFENAGYFDVTLTTTSLNGCTASDTYNNYIYVEPTPTASFSIVQDETTFTTTENIADLVNNSSGAATYLWDFNDGSSNSTEVSPTHSFPTDRGGIYPVQLIAFSPLGCPDTTYQSITVEGLLTYYIPNSFTPDNDEFNNIFMPVISSGIDAYSYTFKIYNRWGEKIFETNDLYSGWDGTFNGKIVEHGIYNWTMQYKTTESDEKRTESGHVNLVK